MSKKIYTKSGYKIIYKDFIVQFNCELVNGYDWYVSKKSIEDGEAIGIKRKDNQKSVTLIKCLDEFRNQKKLY